MLKSISRLIIAVSFIAAGANHFLSPILYLEIMPPYLPWPLALIYVSGIAEVVLGVAVLIPRIRRMAGWGLILLLIAVFPANVHSALYGFLSVPSWILWARLSLQGVLMAWVYWCSLSERICHGR